MTIPADPTEAPAGFRMVNMSKKPPKPAKATQRKHKKPLPKTKWVPVRSDGIFVEGIEEPVDPSEWPELGTGDKARSSPEEWAALANQFWAQEKPDNKLKDMRNVALNALEEAGLDFREVDESHHPYYREASDIVRFVNAFEKLENHHDQEGKETFDSTVRTDLQLTALTTDEMRTWFAMATAAAWERMRVRPFATLVKWANQQNAYPWRGIAVRTDPKSKTHRILELLETEDQVTETDFRAYIYGVGQRERQDGDPKNIGPKRIAKDINKANEALQNAAHPLRITKERGGYVKVANRE